MTRLLIAAATVLALSATVASAKTTKHKNAGPLYDQVTTDVGVSQAPLILGVAY